MHEQNGTAVAEICRSTRWATEDRLEECAKAGISLGTSDAFDGQRLENSAQPPACEGKCEGCSPSNMERICPSRSDDSRSQEKPCVSKRLEIVGIAPNDCRKPLHSESKAELVAGVRPSGTITTENVMRLLEYQQYCCALTGRMLTPQTAALDHIVPVRVGGEHTIENVQILHKDVNRAKNVFTNGQFIAMCREIVAHIGELRE